MQITLGVAVWLRTVGMQVTPEAICQVEMI